MGLPRLGGQGGKGGDVWVTAAKDMTLKKIDLDKDGKVSLEDFAGTVRKEPLLLEAFGQCLPEDHVVKQFNQEFLTKS